MKIWIIAMAGTVLFLGAGIWVQVNLERTTAQFGNELTRTRQAVERSDWPLARVSLTQLTRKWEKTKSFWSLLLSHKEIDAIEQALIRSSQAVASRSRADAYIELGTLNYFLKHIAQRERVNPINIF